MAYDAVNSLVHTIHGLSHSDRISVASSTQESLQSAYDLAASLQRTLECCKLEASMELAASTQFLSQSGTGEGCPPPTFSLDLHHLAQDVDGFAETAKKWEEDIEELWQQKAAKMIEEYVEELFHLRIKPEEDVSSAADDMVGLSDQFRMIRDELAATETAAEAPVRRSLSQIVIWISGMAGIGKTTLAKRVFQDPFVKASFECRAFVTVGREFRLKEVLQAIAAQLNQKMIVEGDEGLHESLCRALTLRKSLIVLDDLWEYNFFFDIIPKVEDKGSRILVTSRTDSHHHYFCIKMRFLNEEESWELLRRKVFGEEGEECPRQLVKAGKKIAEKCEGLPLLIIAVAAQLLSKAQKNPECWQRVAEKPNSVMESASHQISEVLLSSYHVIREELKQCFLYIAAFPLNYIVRRSTIINLWFAEDFVHVLSEYNFSMLCDKNLFMSYPKSWSSLDDTKACSLHCAYWYQSKRVAGNNTFLYIMNSYADGLDERVKRHHRLAIYNNVLFAIKEVHNSMASIPTVLSVICRGPYHQYQVRICWEWKLLRVLDSLTIRFYEFPVEVVKLIRLRYLALTCNENLPRSISKLWNLQFLIVHQHLSIKQVAVDQSYVPAEVWDLEELIHLEIVGRNLPDPRPGAILPNLRKLLGVGVESCTKGILESTPKLEKLRIQIELAPDAAETLRCLGCIPRLHELYSFVSVIMNPTLLCPPPPLSISTSRLRKLSLSGFGYPWEDMSKIAELPNLENLKLQYYAFQGEKWEANEMRFSSLKYLLIEDTDLVQWTAGDETFPTLWYLTMKNCYELEEIPLLSEFDVDIELIDCNPLAETCANQRINAKYSWSEEKVKS